LEDIHGDKYILSCNHVLAGVNARTSQLSGASGVDTVWSPGSSDSGTSSDKLGLLYDFEKIVLDGTTINHFDAAIAKPDNAADVAAGVHTIGSLNGSYSYTSLNPLAVEKYGKVTNHTTGHIMYQLNMLMNFPGKGDAVFYDQFGIVAPSGAFAQRGDSGAVVVDSAGYVVGMIFAVADGLDLAFANPIDPVPESVRLVDRDMRDRYDPARGT
jgi:hypothetical protein